MLITLFTIMVITFTIKNLVKYFYNFIFVNVFTLECVSCKEWQIYNFVFYFEYQKILVTNTKSLALTGTYT